MPIRAWEHVSQFHSISIRCAGHQESGRHPYVRFGWQSANLCHDISCENSSKVLAGNGVFASSSVCTGTNVLFFAVARQSLHLMDTGYSCARVASSAATDRAKSGSWKGCCVLFGTWPQSLSQGAIQLVPSDLRSGRPSDPIVVLLWCKCNLLATGPGTVHSCPQCPHCQVAKRQH